LKITYVYADSAEEWNCSEWRCAIPARAINRLRNHSAQLLDIQSFAQNTPQAQEICAASDLIIVQRNLFGPVLTAIQRWKARDKVLLVDFDDAYPLMPPEGKNYSFWVEGKTLRQVPGREPVWETLDPHPLTQFKWGLRLAHAAMVPSARLAEDWRAYQDIHLLPNFIELERYSRVGIHSHEGVIIGWGGSLSHLHSFTESGLLAALQRVCNARRQVKIMICGDPRVYDQIAIPNEQKLFQAWVPASEWPRVLSCFDIGLAPLSGPYDDRRSWIKVLEYMVMKIPWVASDSPAYNDLRPYGWLVQNTTGAWERVLLDMVDHIGDHKSEAARDPYLYGISQNIDENIEKVLSLYSTIAVKALGEHTQIARL